MIAPAITLFFNMGELSFGADNSLVARNYELGDHYIARNQHFFAIMLSQCPYQH